jgi:5,5'-dehydrodivanillate O-demethylase
VGLHALPQDHAPDDGGRRRTHRVGTVSQGTIADRTAETLVDTDRGIALFRRLLFEQLETVAAGGDPLGAVRGPAVNQCIDLPQEKNKYGRGTAFLREAIEMSHVRHSPIRDRILEMLSPPA